MGRTPTGDVAELDFAPSETILRAITVGSDECPGASRCPMGEPCFAELARRRATVADVVVVNTYLYGLDVASGGTILPEHDVVVFDEAHGLEDIMSTTLSVRIGPGRFVTLGGVIRRILDDPEVVAGVVDAADVLREALTPHVGKRLPIPYPDEVQSALLDARARLERALNALTALEPPLDDAKQKKLRAQLMTGSAIESIDTALAGPSAAAGTRVDFVCGSPSSPHLEIAPLDIGPLLREGVWERRTAILTSATIPATLVQRAGIPTDHRRRARCREPLRLRPQRPAVLRDVAARSAASGLSRCRPRRARRPDHRRWGPDARPVHELGGDGRRGRRR